MNWKILQAIRSYRGDIKPAEHHVLLIYALYARDNLYDDIFIGLDLLQEQTRRSQATIQRALSGLAERKLLKPGSKNNAHVRGYAFDCDTLTVDLTPKKKAYGKEESYPTEDEDYRHAVQYFLLGTQPLPEKYRRRWEQEQEAMRQAEEEFRKELEQA